MEGSKRKRLMLAPYPAESKIPIKKAAVVLGADGDGTYVGAGIFRVTEEKLPVRQRRNISLIENQFSGIFASNVIHPNNEKFVENQILRIPKNNVDFSRNADFLPEKDKI